MRHGAATGQDEERPGYAADLPVLIITPHNGLEALTDTIKSLGLRSKGKKVDLFLNPPDDPLADPSFLPGGRFRRVSQPEIKTVSLAEHPGRTREINQRVAEVAKSADVEVIDPANWICTKDRCAFTDSQSISCFRDANQYSPRTKFFLNCNL